MENFKKWNFLLLLKWIALNAFMGFLAIVAVQEGYVNLIFSNDVTNISYIILGIFVLCMILLFVKTLQTSLEIKSVDANFSDSKSKKYIGSTEGTRRTLLEGLKSKYYNGTDLIKYLTGLPVTLGLIGTIIGFIIMLHGIPESGAGNAAQAEKLVAILTTGMGAALYTTLTGSVLSIWLQLNYVLLNSGLTELFRKITKNEYSSNG